MKVDRTKVAQGNSAKKVYTKGISPETKRRTDSVKLAFSSWYGKFAVEWVDEWYL